MKFSELNPELHTTMRPEAGLHEIMMDCPLCRSRFSIRARLNEGPTPGVWRWNAGLEPSVTWDTVTIEPSIQNHPVSRKQQRCFAHFTVTKGEVVMQ